MLIDEFLNGYYGKAAAPYIRQYLDFMAKEAQGVNLICYTGTDSPLFRYDVMKKAATLWNQAFDVASKESPELGWRVLQGELPVQYVWLVRWNEFKSAAAKANDEWPYDPDRAQAAARWLQIATTGGSQQLQFPGFSVTVPAQWSAITAISEGGTTPQAFVASLK